MSIRRRKQGTGDVPHEDGEALSACSVSESVGSPAINTRFPLGHRAGRGCYLLIEVHDDGLLDNLDRELLPRLDLCCKTNESVAPSMRPSRGLAMRKRAARDAGDALNPGTYSPRTTPISKSRLRRCDLGWRNENGMRLAGSGEAGEWRAESSAERDTWAGLRIGSASRRGRLTSILLRCCPL
mgnify:FL=1